MRSSNDKKTTTIVSAQAPVFTLIHTFTAATDGANPESSLILSGAKLYGATSQAGPNGGGTAFQFDTTTSQFTTLHSFPASSTDGLLPAGSLVRGPGGILYGATELGGTDGNGTVYQIDTTNTETVLHNFTGVTDGIGPEGALLLSGGGLEGVTYFAPSSPFQGTAYKLSMGIHTFHTFGSGNDGKFPMAGMTAAGSFVYGATQTGGTGHNGVVYQFDSTGAETILYNFTGAADGGEPTILSSDGLGNLYGATVLGGASTSCPVFATAIGCGVVFMDASGNLYGTTIYGGSAMERSSK
jgi:uncharacterized repeat protein (TIGR03803 family)